MISTLLLWSASILALSTLGLCYLGWWPAAALTATGCVLAVGVRRWWRRVG